MDAQVAFYVLLAVAVVLIIPVLARINGMSFYEYVKSLFLGGVRKKGTSTAKDTAYSVHTPKFFNSRSDDLTRLVSKLFTISRKKKTIIVYPGTIEYNGDIATILCFVVTPDTIYALNCFGYAGTILGKESEKSWIQRINGSENKIDNPVRLNKEQHKLIKAALESIDLADIKIKVFAIFTNSHVQIKSDCSDEVMKADDFIDYYKNEIANEGDLKRSEEIAKSIFGLVTVMREQKA